MMTKTEKRPIAEFLIDQARCVITLQLVGWVIYKGLVHLSTYV